MDPDTGQSPARRRLALLGWAVLVLGLPLAFFAALHPPNEYKATIGVDALDCQGPYETYLFAIPALLIYGIGLVLNGRRWRKRRNALAATVCLTVCIALFANLARAAKEEERQAASCQ